MGFGWSSPTSCVGWGDIHTLGCLSFSRRGSAEKAGFASSPDGGRLALQSRRGRSEKRSSGGSVCLASVSARTCSVLPEKGEVSSKRPRFFGGGKGQTILKDDLAPVRSLTAHKYEGPGVRGTSEPSRFSFSWAGRRESCSCCLHSPRPREPYCAPTRAMLSNQRPRRADSGESSTRLGHTQDDNQGAASRDHFVTSRPRRQPGSCNTTSRSPQSHVRTAGVEMPCCLRGESSSGPGRASLCGIKIEVNPHLALTHQVLRMPLLPDLPRNRLRVIARLRAYQRRLASARETPHPITHKQPLL